MINFVEDWGGFEKFVAELHNLENIKVEHNVKLKSKTGATHQIDVLLTSKKGPYEYKTIIECRFWNHTIKRTHVDAMVTSIRDLNVSHGVFFTTKGYQKGAKQAANHHGIQLFKIKELTNEDWGKPGRILDFYLQIISRSIFNFRVEARSWVDGSQLPQKPFSLGLHLGGPETEGKKAPLYKEEDVGRKEFLEDVIDKHTYAVASEAIKGMLFKNGEDGTFYLVVQNLCINFEGTWKLRADDGSFIYPSKITFDLGIKLNQSRYISDRMSNYKYAILVEDMINNKKYIGQKKKEDKFSLLEEQAQALPSKEEPLKNGSIFQIWTYLWFDVQELGDISEIPVLQISPPTT